MYTWLNANIYLLCSSQSTVVLSAKVLHYTVHTYCSSRFYRLCQIYTPLLLRMYDKSDEGDEGVKFQRRLVL